MGPDDEIHVVARRRHADAVNRPAFLDAIGIAHRLRAREGRSRCQDYDDEESFAKDIHFGRTIWRDASAPSLTKSDTSRQEASISPCPAAGSPGRRTDYFALQLALLRSRKWELPLLRRHRQSYGQDAVIRSRDPNVQ